MVAAMLLVRLLFYACQLLLKFSHFGVLGLGLLVTVVVQAGTKCDDEGNGDSPHFTAALLFGWLRSRCWLAGFRLGCCFLWGRGFRCLGFGT